MDETTYSSEDVIDIINRRFIPVRVDNDRRPDINARYNQGGWPTTAVLTHEGELLKGATYVPPEQMHRLLVQLDAFYSDPANRREVASKIEELRDRRNAGHVSRPGPLKPDIPERIFSFLDANFDEDFGGFGADQKFPQTATLHFLLDLWARSNEPRAKEVAQRTLQAMAGGGMYDHVHGGFFRYSTTRDFSVPHFEKMLEDLGGLMLACARASALFEDAELARVAKDVRSYLDAYLWDPQLHAYGGSQDADEAYYALDAAGRAALPVPYVDHTVYTAWNAEVARALIIAGPLLEKAGGDPADWTARGIEVLDSLWTKLLSDGLMCRSYDGQPHDRGLLQDQAWAALAAMSAFEATGALVWLRRAADLLTACEQLYDEVRGGYRDRLHVDGALGRLSEPSLPLDENALMAQALIALADVAPEPRWRERARVLLEGGAESYRSYGTFAAGYGSAAMEFLSPPIDVRIIGPASARETSTLREAARRSVSPPVRINTVDPIADTQRLSALGQTPCEQPTAFACNEQACFARATDATELKRALSRSFAKT